MTTETLPLDADLISTLSNVTTATLTTVLLKKGLRHVWLKGTMPIKSDQPRRVGRAFTLRFVPAREDLATPESWSSPISTRAAIEAMPAGCIAVVDAMGVTDAQTQEQRGVQQNRWRDHHGVVGQSAAQDCRQDDRCVSHDHRHGEAEEDGVDDAVIGRTLQDSAGEHPDRTRDG